MTFGFAPCSDFAFFLPSHDLHIPQTSTVHSAKSHLTSPISSSPSSTQITRRHQLPQLLQEHGLGNPFLIETPSSFSFTSSHSHNSWAGNPTRPLLLLLYYHQSRAGNPTRSLLHHNIWADNPSNSQRSLLQHILWAGIPSIIQSIHLLGWQLKDMVIPSISSPTTIELASQSSSFSYFHEQLHHKSLGWQPTSALLTELWAGNPRHLHTFNPFRRTPHLSWQPKTSSNKLLYEQFHLVQLWAGNPSSSSFHLYD